MAAKSKIRRRGEQPANWQFRDGRPRWVPSPSLRKAGWKGMDLKDTAGAFLTKGPSIDAADAINAAVAGWRAGAEVPAELAAIAPSDTVPAAPKKAPLEPLSIGALVDAFGASDELLKKKDGTPRPAATVRDYKGKLKRMVDVFAGYPVLPPRDDKKAQAVYAAAVARIRAHSIFTYKPFEKAGRVVDPWLTLNQTLRDKCGLHQAFGVMAVASVWLTWCRRRRSRAIDNWTADVARETPPGRIRVATWPEIAALVAAAEKLGRPAVGDAVVLAVDLSWSEADVLALTWDRLVTDATGRIRAATGQRGRIKTHLKGAPPLCSMGMRRLAAIRARNQAAGIAPLKVIHLKRERNHTRAEDADNHYFRKLFAKVREEAAKDCPSVAGLTFADTRDTGWSLGRQAGLSDDQTASRSLQSRRNISDLGDKHYGEIGPEIADQARDLLDPYIEAELKKHKVNL